jgi:hypothetical protein
MVPVGIVDEESLFFLVLRSSTKVIPGRNGVTVSEPRKGVKSGAGERAFQTQTCIVKSEPWRTHRLSVHAMRAKIPDVRGWE